MRIGEGMEFDTEEKVLLFDLEHHSVEAKLVKNSEVFGVEIVIRKGEVVVDRRYFYVYSWIRDLMSGIFKF